MLCGIYIMVSDLKKRTVMTNKFAGKVAVITGASTGIGLATAKRLIQEGIRCTDVSADYTIRPDPSEAIKLLRTLNFLIQRRD